MLLGNKAAFIRVSLALFVIILESKTNIMKTFASILLFFTSTSLLYGQLPDLIIKTDKTKIHCKILSIDEKYIDFEYLENSEEGDMIRRKKLDIIFVETYQYDYLNDPDYKPPVAELDYLDLPQNYKMKEKANGKASLTDEQLRFAIRTHKGYSYVGVAFTVGGLAAVVTGLTKRSDYIQERKNCWSNHDFEGWEDAGSNAVKMSFVALTGVLVTATGSAIWGVNSHKVFTYEMILVNRDLEARISPSINFNQQHNTAYAGLHLIVTF